MLYGEKRQDRAHHRQRALGRRAQKWDLCQAQDTGRQKQGFPGFPFTELTLTRVSPTLSFAPTPPTSPIMKFGFVSFVSILAVALADAKAQPKELGIETTYKPADCPATAKTGSKISMHYVCSMLPYITWAYELT